MKNIIVILLLLLSVGTVQGWDSESGLTEDELFDIIFNSPYLYEDINNPKWYDPAIDPINDYLVKLETRFTTTPPNINVDILIKKMIWTGSCYVEDTDFYNLDSSVYYELKTNTTEHIAIPMYKHVDNAFKNNLDELKGDNWKTVDIDPDYPDLLNISVDIDCNGESLDFSHLGYMAFSDYAIDSLQGSTQALDYGYALDGKGSEGGSGSIYDGVNMYGTSEHDGGTGGAFNTLFFYLIPLLFILSIIKFMGKFL